MIVKGLTMARTIDLRSVVEVVVDPGSIRRRWGSPTWPILAIM
jgi:hypothetical protein